MIKDFIMFINAGILPSEQFTYLKLIKTKTDNLASNGSTQKEKTGAKDLWQNLPYSLKVAGFTADSQVLFNYTNKKQDFEQSFSINVKKYNAHQDHLPLLMRSKIDEEQMSVIERLDRERPEGMYQFLPQYDDQLPKQYSKLVEMVK